MAKQVHQRFIDAILDQTLRVTASEKSAAVLYRGEIRRVASDMRLTWSDADIESDVRYLLSKEGSYYVEVLTTFVKSPNSTVVTVSVDGGESAVVELNSEDGLVHLVSVAVEVFES